LECRIPIEKRDLCVSSDIPVGEILMLNRDRVHELIQLMHYEAGRFTIAIKVTDSMAIATNSL